MTTQTKWTGYRIINAQGNEQIIKRKADAVQCAKVAAQARPKESVELWTRPFWAIGVVRHYPETGETLLHGYDRYGREQPGDSI